MIWEPWVLFAAVMTLGKALGALVNEYFQVRAIHLLFWMRTTVLLVLLPLMFLFSAPQDILFYVYLVGASLLVPYADILYIGLTAKSGAGVVTRILPLVVAFMFVTWLPFSPALVLNYIDKPFRAAGIILSIAGSIYFAMKLRACPISFEALKKIMPSLILWSLATAIGKLALERIDGGSTTKVYYYLLIQCVVVWLSYTVMMGSKKLNGLLPHMELESRLFQPRVLAAGLMSGLVWVLATGSRWMAIDDVENPAYVSVVGLSAPFLVMLIYKLVGKREEAHIGAGIGIITCAALLIVFTKM